MVSHHYFSSTWFFVFCASLLAVAVAIAIPYLSRRLPRRR